MASMGQAAVLLFLGLAASFFLGWQARMTFVEEKLETKKADQSQQEK